VTWLSDSSTATGERAQSAITWDEQRTREAAIAASALIAALNNMYPVVQRNLWIVASC